MTPAICLFEANSTKQSKDDLLFDPMRFVSRPSESSPLSIPLRRHEAKRNHKACLSQSSFLLSLSLMSICSGAVDGSLMSKNQFVLIIHYLEDFKVGNLDRFSMVWNAEISTLSSSDEGGCSSEMLIQNSFLFLIMIKYATIESSAS